jgi:5'-3' exoribonuclease 2
LWEPGYRERYYLQKFGVDYADQEFRKKYGILFVTIGAFITHPYRVATHYVEGLAWVLAYYYQGVRLHSLTALLLLISSAQTPSWQWYYPYHFAPFAADFDGVDKMDIRFELGKPFQPFEQLMGVFPAARLVLANSFER